MFAIITFNVDSCLSHWVKFSAMHMKTQTDTSFDIFCIILLFPSTKCDMKFLSFSLCGFFTLSHTTAKSSSHSTVYILLKLHETLSWWFCVLFEWKQPDDWEHLFMNVNMENVLSCTRERERERENSSTNTCAAAAESARETRRILREWNSCRKFSP